MRRLLLLLVAVAAVFAAAPVPAAAPPYVIHGDRSIGGLRLYQPAAMAEAVRLFGKPATRRVERGRSCVAAWPRIGLVINFFTFEASPCDRGAAITFTITSRGAWRTGVGLRVGDSARRVRSLYPRARLRSGMYGGWNGFWLITRRACAEVGGSPYPGLLARMRNGRVSALVVGGTICD